MRTILAIIVIGLLAETARAGERTQNFDSDPKWQESNNHLNPKGEAVQVTQDFGYCTSNYAGKDPGEMGGLVTRASEMAYYAAKIPTKTLDDKLVASGTFALTQSAKGGIFFGFFNGDQPGASGRPFCSLGMDLGAERDGGRLAVRLITAKNQSCGTFITPFLPGKFRPTPIRNDGTRYTWKLEYDPQGANGLGRFTFTFHGDQPKPGSLETPGMPDSYKHEAQIRFPDTTSFTVDLPKGYKEQGTTFDHFGMMNMMKPGGHLHVYFDDLQFLDQSEDFSTDPHWDAVRNRATYQAEPVAAQNFGFSNTNFAGGEKPGEMGGTFWRTEGPVASYADVVGPLTLSDKLVAHGKLSFLSGSPDSGMCIGWFNSKTVDQKDGLRDFVGVRVEGPTRIGHYFGPVAADDQGLLGKFKGNAPILVPGKALHDWSIEYDPKANGGNGALVVHLDKESGTLDFRSPPQKGSQLDRFGVFTPRVGGSQVKIYFDDITYTATPQ